MGVLQKAFSEENAPSYHSPFQANRSKRAVSSVISPAPISVLSTLLPDHYPVSRHLQFSSLWLHRLIASPSISPIPSNQCVFLFGWQIPCPLLTVPSRTWQWIHIFESVTFDFLSSKYFVIFCDIWIHCYWLLSPLKPFRKWFWYDWWFCCLSEQVFYVHVRCCLYDKDSLPKLI